MSIMEELGQAKALIESVMRQISSITSLLSDGWTESGVEGHRLYGPLNQLKAYCLDGGDTPENRALWYFGHTAQLLNVSFMVAMNQAEEDAMMDSWIDCQNKYFPGITSYLYPYPDGVQMKYGEYPQSSYPPYMQWYSNQTPQQARTTFEENIAVNWTQDNVDRWAQEEIEQMDYQYAVAGDKEKFLADNPWYITP